MGLKVATTQVLTKMAQARWSADGGVSDSEALNYESEFSDCGTSDETSGTKGSAAGYESSFVTSDGEDSADSDASYVPSELRLACVLYTVSAICKRFDQYVQTVKPVS